MKKKKGYLIVLVFVCITTLVVPSYSYSQESQPQKVFKAEELDQILAPIALYPDSLIAQILMASTYPLEVVEAARWANQNKNLTGDALTKALEQKTWDPSVKSLVNFPKVLQMMNEKLEWTRKLGDAVLAQQKDVMDTVQELRAKAYAQGTLKTTNEEKVIVQNKVIVIEPANPQVIYVPVYNPTVVYGAWPYPAYPPYYYYPPGYVAGTAFSFAAGVAVGAAWGYAWGNCNWGAHAVHYNVNQNININNNINRTRYATKTTPYGKTAGQGSWQHNPENRKGVAYRDQATAQQYKRTASADSVKNREAYRGKTGQGAGGISAQPSGTGARPGTVDRGAKPSTTGTAGRGGKPSAPGTMDRGAKPSATGTAGRGGKPSASTMETGGRQSAFGGMEKGSNARAESNRGQASRQGMSAAQPAQKGGGGARGVGGARGGGGGKKR
ncbi:MAG: DUF3300 domain-containing protein [Syntrophorhabdales bacterium]|jgi:hypothetical protein